MVQVWNSLPNELRVAESYSSFVGCSIVGTAPYVDVLYAQPDWEVFSVHFSFSVRHCLLSVLLLLTVNCLFFCLGKPFVLPFYCLSYKVYSHKPRSADIYMRL